MNRAEAIKVLNTYDANFDEYTAEEIADAIDMATEALKYDSKAEILRAVKILVNMINSVDGVYASIHLFADGNATISIYPTDEESEE